jgi:hypothetical protein
MISSSPYYLFFILNDSLTKNSLENESNALIYFNIRPLIDNNILSFKLSFNNAYT